MSITRAGRPRLTTQRRPGSTARDEILDAAGELFTTLGYTGTSTRTIAEAVGIRQASLYHYFKTKDDILCALLSQTVMPTLMIIDSLVGSEPALSRGRAPACAGAFRRPPAAGGSLEPGCSVPATRIARCTPRAVLVGPGAAAVALSGLEQGHRRRNRRRRSGRRSAVPIGGVAGQHVDQTAGPGTDEIAGTRCGRVHPGARHADSATTRLRARSHLELTRYAATN
jgi:AcrR family transcriptional regulator